MSKNLAMAWNIQSKNKKKMAKGGEVDTAAGEKRPMPDDKHQDSKDVSQNSGKKAPKDDSWTGKPTVKQSQRISATPLSRPRIAGSDVFSVKDELDLENSAAPASPKEEPKAAMDEAAHAGDAPAPSEVSPHTGETQDDMSRRHAMEMAHFARGGEVPLEDGQPEEEEKEEHYDSLSDAIMAKKRKKMADGGMVDLEANSEESANEADVDNYDAIKKEQYDDGQLSKQPSDSNEKGDSREDDAENDHDASLVDAIRKRLKSRRGF